MAKKLNKNQKAVLDADKARAAEARTKAEAALGQDGKTTKLEKFVPTPNVDPLDPACRMRLRLPTSSTRGFLSRAQHYDVKGRLGDGPCTVLTELVIAMPNGDYAIEGDTFDPVVERMSPAKYSRLVEKGYISPADEKTEVALLKAHKGGG